MLCEIPGGSECSAPLPTGRGGAWEAAGVPGPSLVDRPRETVFSFPSRRNSSSQEDRNAHLPFSP